MKRLASGLAMFGLLVGCGQHPATVTIGDPAPAFELRSLDGETVDSRSLVGETAVINFWATWCQPCLGEIPELVALAASGHTRVVGIALDEEGWRTVAPFVERHGVDYTVLLGDQELFQRFGGFTLPYTLVLDDQGTVVNIHRGPIHRDVLERDLAAADARPPRRGPPAS